MLSALPARLLIDDTQAYICITSEGAVSHYTLYYQQLSIVYYQVSF